MAVMESTQESADEVSAYAISDAPSSPLSSVLSTLSQSPSPPPEMFSDLGPYPSPPASQNTTPPPDGMASNSTSDKEGPPPAKRRKISTERSTEYLDLRSSDVDPDQRAELDRLLHVLHRRKKIVVIAGAGISVSAGIPDFRSSKGLFKSLKDEHKLKGSGKDLFDASVYKDDPSTSSFHDMVSSMSRLTKDAKPTAFHHMLATVASEDRLLRLYSQNVDGIDTGIEPLQTSVPLRKDDNGKWPRTVQLHGGLDKMVCSKCHHIDTFNANLFSGPVPPSCPNCEEFNSIRVNHEGKRSHGIGRLRPRMVLYNEANPDDNAIGSVTTDDLRKRPDAVIVAGTTLKVPGVKRIVREMCKTVRGRRGGVAIWINTDPPPVAKELEDCFDIIVQGTCDEVARRAAMRKWDEPREQDSCSEVSEDDIRRADARKAEVHLPRCQLTHADLIPLPSELHYNNSFYPPPPSGTPRKPLEPPSDWSPITSRGTSIVSSIETDGGLAVVTNAGLLTPSKPQKFASVKKLASLNDTLKDVSRSAKLGRPPGKAKAKAAAPAKKRNVVYVKPAKAQVKAPKKAPAQRKENALTNAFQQTKATKVEVQIAKKPLPSPHKSPSKLNQLPPQDARINTSPSKAKPVFPNLFSENASQTEKKEQMSISSLTS